MNKIILALLGIVASSQLATAQESASHEHPRERNSWEIGIGGSVWQFNRVSFSNFQKVDGDYTYDMKNHHAVWGGQLYAARELNSHFFLDFQCNLGATKNNLHNKTKWLGMAGGGLQWRLGEYFKSPYIDPFLRVGANYMYKGFDINYAGDESIGTDQMQWIMENHGNKNGRDKTSMFVAAFGGGVNLWLNDRFGIGLQADYLLMPYKNVANSIQGNVRLMWRFGGKSKKPKPTIKYIDRPVEKIVERVVEVEKIVKVPADIQPTGTDDLVALFDQIYFDFDKDILTMESETILDGVARYLKTDTSRCYLITGQTDARGTEDYNKNLSERRAYRVVKGLVERGVPTEMLKYRGVGKRIAAIPVSEEDNVRRGDRKITIELVTNMDYWEHSSFQQFTASEANVHLKNNGFSIQIIASSTPISKDNNKLNTFKNEIVEYVTSGRWKYKYCVGLFASRIDAQKRLTEITKIFPDAFIVTILNGEITQ
uniref:Outer membrane protein n=1 Tax=virus sp. ct5rm7 TaxID=2827298 RepID=A0A8S5RGC2_9VIRU|nr:MAG TPA: outer membrane protein [virus sp. ct5rm7]